ncbi:MAG: hypothetical protein JW894_07305 [Bacteroidales bacterium]|nr:hypothetical protein [Bacteroidales bacterium]
MKRKNLYSVLSLIILTAFIIIISCSKDDNNGDSSQKYSVGGTVEGLTGSGLVLQNNGTDDLAVSDNGTFTFPARLEDSTTYDVTIESYPVGQTCYVEDGSGLIDGADVTDVRVVCETPPIAGDCSSGSIVYAHDLVNEYGGFRQEIVVSGSISFTCDDEGNLSGSGSLTVTVSGTITTECEITTYSGDAAINVTLTGTYSVAQVMINLSEIWYVGSPMVSGTTEDICDPDVQPFYYPLIETSISFSLPFPTINGHTIEQPYSGEAASGGYSWTLYIE